MNSKTRKPAVHGLSELKFPNYKGAHAGGYSEANSTMTNSGHEVLAFLFCFLIADWRRKKLPRVGGCPLIPQARAMTLPLAETEET